MASFVSQFVGQAIVSKNVTKKTQVKTTTQAAFKRSAPKASPKASPKAKGKPAKGGKSVKGWTGDSTNYNLGAWYGADRKLYLPGGLLDRAEIPSYLNGTLAGDYGYDPLNLGENAAQVASYRSFELIHARWAMLATLGCVLPEAAQAFGDGTQINGSVWWQTGAAMLDGGLLKYYGLTIPLPLFLVALAEIGAMFFVETYRSANDGPAGTDLDPLYPGGKYFDPFGLADDPDAFAQLQVKEIKNGRLALVSILGYAVQAGVTGTGPFENWAGHVADPFGYNLFTVLSTARVPNL
jgi:light-harvesting complex II chlorophyll a/b binding protein 5